MSITENKNEQKDEEHVVALVPLENKSPSNTSEFEIIEANKDKPKLPVAVLSKDFFRKITNTIIRLPRKKEASRKIDTKNLVYPISNHQLDPKFTLPLVKQAIIHATTEEYLRGILAFFFSEERVTIKLIQSKENQLEYDEIIGASMLTARNFHEIVKHKVIPFKEELATHYIVGEEVAIQLLDIARVNQTADVVIINIHHNFIHVFSNTMDHRTFLNAMGQIASGRIC